MYPVLGPDYGFFTTAERCRAGPQFNKTLALGIERLKSEGSCWVMWNEPIYFVYNRSVSRFILCLCKKKKNSIIKKTDVA